MKNILIIYSHPREQSFCGAIRDAISQMAKEHNANVILRDLYRMNFKLELTHEELAEGVGKDALQEQEHIKNADIIALVFPIWWQNCPANLKGYLDRVLTKGFAYDDNPTEGEKSIGLLKNKKFILFTPIGNLIEDYENEGLASAITCLYEKGIVKFCGADFAGHQYFSAVHDATDEKRQEMLEETKQRIKHLL